MSVDNLDAYNDSGEFLELSHLVGDNTSLLEFRDLEIRVTVRNRNKTAVSDVILLTGTATHTHLRSKNFH